MRKDLKIAMDEAKNNSPYLSQKLLMNIILEVQNGWSKMGYFKKVVKRFREIKSCQKQ